MDAPLLLQLADGDRPAVERLRQLYSHDLSEVRGTLPTDEGMYKAGRLPSYFGDPDRSATVKELFERYPGRPWEKRLGRRARGLPGSFLEAEALVPHGVECKLQ